MKRLLFGLCSLFLLSACGNQAEEKAGQLLEKARQSFQCGQYNEAKIQIDSIKVLYPKAYETRRQGIYLMQEIELKEQQNSLAYLDSMQTQYEQKLSAIRDRYVFEKNEEYQQIGQYLWPTQTVEKNIHQTYLRFQVNERGVMSMTSVYCGSPIHHTSVKVSAPDGTFAETPVSADSYETTDLGKALEYGDYQLGTDGNVIEFICLNKNKNLKVEYRGDHKFTTTMRLTDRQAASAVYELYTILAALENIRKEQEEAQLKVRFITQKMTERATKDSLDSEN